MFKDFVVLTVDNIAIVGQIFLPDKKTRYPAVCLCHGVPSGNPPDPGDGGYPLLAERFCQDDLAVFIFNFRGTGDSGGNLDIPGWTRDLQAAVDYLWHLPDIDRSRLSLVGFSAGAAVSIYTASQDKRVSGVAACACPADFSLFIERDEPQAIINHYREIGAIRDADFPASARAWLDDLLPITPANHVAGISPRPLLLVHGSQDETVPVGHAHRLYDAAGEPKQLIILNEAGHRLRQDDQAITAVLEWLRAFYQYAGP